MVRIRTQAKQFACLGTFVEKVGPYAPWKPTVFQRPEYRPAFLHGELPFPDPLPRSAPPYKKTALTAAFYMVDFSPEFWNSFAIECFQMADILRMEYAGPINLTPTLA